MSKLISQILNTNLSSLDEIFAQKNKIYTFLNPVSYILASDHENDYEDFDAIFADGSILVAFIRLFYGTKVIRRSFDMTSVAPALFDYAQKNNKTVYVIASKQEEVEKAIYVIKDRYPALNFIAYRNGYFKSDIEEQEEMSKILQLQPDFLIVGMGVLKQETFLTQVRKMGFSGTGFTCGGFIHQTSKDEIDYYPKWIDKYNLRFIYRIFKEKHTRKRYLKAAFVFPFIFLKDKLRH